MSSHTRKMEKLIVILLCLPVFCNGQASGHGLQPHTRWEAVVEATIDKIRSKSILVDDKHLMTRIAAIETDFGKNSAPNTGGIWRITDVILETVKNSCKYTMRTVCNDILEKFSFDITKATISNMDVPLYSALVMDIYLSITKDKTVSADFWTKLIQSKGDNDNSIENDDNFPNPCTRPNILNNKMRFKHPKLLTKYIQCQLTGQMEIVECPKGAKYDELQGVCDPQIIGIPPSYVLYKAVNPCTIEALRKGQFYFANPSDKSTFIQCNEMGTAFLMHCPKNTIWSQQAYTCIHDSSTIFCTFNPCKSSTKDHPPYYENPNDRKSYIFCNKNGNATILQCPFGKVWVQAELKCVNDLKSLITYTTPKITANPTDSDLFKVVNPCTIEALRKGQFYFANPSDKSTFIQCNEMGTAFLMHCPKNTIWSQQAYTCIHDSSTISCTFNPCKSSTKNYYENPDDRKSYIFCTKKRHAKILQCPFGKVWVQAELKCVNDSMSLITHTTPKMTAIPPDSGLHKGLNPCNNQALRNGQFYFGNPSDRSTFIQCNEMGTAFLMHCPKSLVWSPQVNACVHRSI